MRFRLKRPEVQLFSQQQCITEALEFGAAPNDQIRFVLERANNDQFAIMFQEHTIILQVPQQLVQEWTLTDLVGFEEEIETAKGKTIKVLVEKDFACLDKNDEENEGTYANPKADC